MCNRLPKIIAFRSKEHGALKHFEGCTFPSTPADFDLLGPQGSSDMAVQQQVTDSPEQIFG